MSDRAKEYLVNTCINDMSAVMTTTGHKIRLHDLLENFHVYTSPMSVKPIEYSDLYKHKAWGGLSDYNMHKAVMKCLDHQKERPAQPINFAAIRAGLNLSE